MKQVQSGIFVNARGPDHRAMTADAMELDEESFRLLILETLKANGAKFPINPSAGIFTAKASHGPTTKDSAGQ